MFFDNLSIKHYTGPLVEETHYYPFGLTMAGISYQALKPYYSENKNQYNGKQLQNKEFADGTGLDWYDYGARIYDSQIMRLMTVDPKAYQYFQLSPYTYVANNPIRYADKDGREIVDKDGNIVKISDPVKDKKGNYTVNYTFKEGTSKKVQKDFMKNGGRVINSMVQIAAGREMVSDAVKSKDLISVKISSNSKMVEKDDGSSDITGGTTEITTKYESAKTGEKKNGILVTIYEGSINEITAEGGSDKSKVWDENKLTQEQKVGEFGVHEFFHATNPSHVSDLSKGIKLSDASHQEAYKKEAEAIKQYGEINKKEN